MADREGFDDSILDGDSSRSLAEHHLDRSTAWLGGVLTVALAVMVFRTEAAEPAGQAVQASRGAAAEAIDPAEVCRKIAALAAPDETVPYEERAVNWLRKRHEQIVPQLIAALEDENPKVAQQCLDLLKGVAPSKELTEALIAKAGDEKSPLRYGALRQIERLTADPRAVRLLDQASTQATVFPEPVVRARWAWLAGHQDQAVDLLKPVLATPDGSKTTEAIRLLGEIGGAGSIAVLEAIAAGDRWGWAAEAYLALAKIDPTKHGLTQNQAALLKTWRGGKETGEHFHQRMKDLARLDRQEVRPLVLQMLRDREHEGQRAALLILTAWNDKEASPDIRELMRDRFICQAAVVAYLTIDDSPQAEKDVLDFLGERRIPSAPGGDIFRELPTFDSEEVLRGIATAGIPADRKLAMLRAARDRQTGPIGVARAFRVHTLGEEALRGILVALMDEETDLPSLGVYCDLAAADQGKRFTPQVRRSMELLSSEPTVAAGGEHASDSTAGAAASILAAVAAYDLRELAPHVEKLMRSQNPVIRTAAQAAGARLRIPGAMNDLYAQLDSEDANVRRQAAETLMGIKVVDETERASREEAVLARLGTPSEDYTLRVLVTCGGEKAIQALEPILDDPDAQRAVYAAWVLAQLPDQAAATEGLRRVAIFGMFHQQGYQQGSGIDFRLAPHLDFHQVIARLNPAPKAEATRMGPVQIPSDLLVPFSWDEAEQQYAVRCYRLAEVGGHPYSVDVGFLEGRWMVWTAPQRPTTMDKTHLPLLDEIALHDSHVERLMVQGRAVAHFKYRQLAAKAMAAIRKEPATYRGLAGEALDSEAFPQPYEDQDQLLARFLVEQVRKAQLPSNSPRDQGWQPCEKCRVVVSRLQEEFGPPILDAIRQEGERQQVDLKNVLPPPNP